jgi:hypothetical protein
MGVSRCEMTRCGIVAFTFAGRMTSFRKSSCTGQPSRTICTMWYTTSMCVLRMRDVQQGVRMESRHLVVEHGDLVQRGVPIHAKLRISYGFAGMPSAVTVESISRTASKRLFAHDRRSPIACDAPSTAIRYVPGAGSKEYSLSCSPHRSVCRITPLNRPCTEGSSS